MRSNTNAFLTRLGTKAGKGQGALECAEIIYIISGVCMFIVHKNNKIIFDINNSFTYTLQTKGLIFVIQTR